MGSITIVVVRARSGGRLGRDGIDKDIMGKQGPEISLVAPVYDEEENLRPLYEQITQTLGDAHSYEILFVDDGSRDGSFDVLAELQKADGKIRVIRFRKNFGQTAALGAGFEHAQ